jgi:hypothetical protein
MAYYSRIRRSRPRPPLVVVNSDPNLDADANLLRVLSETVGKDGAPFDACDISGNAYWTYPQLRVALHFLDLRWDRAKYLQPRSLNRVSAWRLKNDGREMGGRLLLQNLGFRIVPAPEQRRWGENATAAARGIKCIGFRR